MSYQKHDFKNGQVLTAEHLNEIEDGIVAIEKEAVTSIELSSAVNDALAQAKASGEFDGRDGDDYVLTEADKVEIAEMAAERVEVPDSDGNVDYGAENYGKLLYVGTDGIATVLLLGAGLAIVNGVLTITSSQVTAAICGDATICGNTICGGN